MQTTLQKALFTIKKLKQMVQEQHKKFEPVAIVGLSCRFPQAIGKAQYWQMLSEGKNVISHLPEQRWNLLRGTEEFALRDKNHPYWGGFLSDIAAFDAYFFGVSPREAIRMDPQHRLLLEVAYEAIEDAGIPIDDLAGSKTGVFASLYVSQLAHMQRMDVEMDALYLPTGNAMSIAANRLSYLFDLRGPSIVIDSACSSSMTALHLACLNLNLQSCDLALVCGAKLNLLPYINYVLTRAKMLSPDGQCKTFDAQANGYVQGEGVGVVILKPLSKALQHKDRIYAVILGSAINQDGKTNGLTAPNGLQQEALLTAAYQQANINVADISYVECHGTGTFLGDPIEVQALGEVISKDRVQQKPCWIGSVKTNIGHLEPAAGIAGIIKVALALKYQKIPPHLNFVVPNPHIAFDKYKFQIPQKLEDWPKYGDVRIAGLSGFGFGGTNAHVVMREITEEEKKSRTTIAVKRNLEVLTLSAKSQSALKKLVTAWHDYLAQNLNLDIAQICYNSHIRRSHYSHRVAILADSTAELCERLAFLAKKFEPSDVIFMSVEPKTHNSSLSTKMNPQEIDPSALAHSYVQHANINWQQYEAERYYELIDMPTYPWEHKEYWPPLDHKKSEPELLCKHPLQGRQIFSPLPSLQFEFKVETKLLPDLQDTYNILHAGYYLEMLAFAVQTISQQMSFTIEDHHFLSPLVASANDAIVVQLIFEKIADQTYSFQFYSTVDKQKNWIMHAYGKMLLTTEIMKIDSIKAIKKRCLVNKPAEELYQKIVAMGMPAGTSIRWTQQFWLGKNEILCEFQQPTDPATNENYSLSVHPGIFDASIQPLFGVLSAEFTKPYIASQVEKMQFFGFKQPPYYLWGILQDVKPDDEKIYGDCYLMNDHHEIMATFKNICLSQLDNKIHIDQLMQTKIKSADLNSLSASERKEKIVQFLTEQVSIIFSIPQSDIDIHRSLADMGIDSLMALVLLRAIEVGLESTYSMQALLEGPSITDIAEVIVKAHPNLNDLDNPWITFRKHQTKAEYRLFCFPYGGGGASIYRDWQQDLPDTIEVCPIQLPGRETRLDEKALTDINVLLDLLLENLGSELTLPFAFFGHSFGSLIAFELTRRLRKNHLPMPIHLFVSAFPDPRTPTKSLDILLSQLQAIGIRLSDIDNPTAIEHLSESQLVQLTSIFNENGIIGYGDYLKEKEIIKVLLPIFMGDMSLVKSYHYQAEPSLDVPITVFVGKQDGWVSYEDHLKWTEHTQKKCIFREFDSGHLFLKELAIKQEMLAEITQCFKEISYTQ